MVFSDTTNKLGLLQDIEQIIFGTYGSITSDTNRLYDFTARVNRAQDKLGALIMSVDGRWQWDDTNNTDLPIGSTNLVSGQQDYSMDIEFLDIIKVVAVDAAGNKTLLRPMDITDREGERYITALAANNTGIPNSYDKFGNTLMLSPIPNYNATGGLVVYYRRKPSYFVYGDTTKQPGLPYLFHRYLSLETALDYAMAKGLPIAGGVMRGGYKTGLLMTVSEFEKSVEEFYSARSKDEQKFIKSISRSSR